MATITATIDRNTVPGAVLATWADLATGDVGAGVPIAYAADLTGQVSGTFGGGTVTWQGSNDNTNWHPLTQRSGTTNMKTSKELGKKVTEPFARRTTWSSSNIPSAFSAPPPPLFL